MSSRQARFGALLVGAVLLAGGFALSGAAAQSIFDEQSDETEVVSVSRRVDLDEETVFNALALGINDVGRIADIDQDMVVASDRARTSNLDEDDVFAAIALGDSGFGRSSRLGGDGFFSDDDSFRVSRSSLFEDDDDLFGSRGSGLSRSGGSGFFSDDDFFSVGDLDRSSVTEQRTSQRVNIDRDDVFLSLALGRGRGVDAEDLFDVDRTRVTSRSVDRNVDLDEEDVFLRLALG